MLSPVMLYFNNTIITEERKASHKHTLLSIINIHKRAKVN